MTSYIYWCKLLKWNILHLQWYKVKRKEKKIKENKIKEKKIKEKIKVFIFYELWFENNNYSKYHQYQFLHHLQNFYLLNHFLKYPT
jgi:hypothetical protein